MEIKTIGVVGAGSMGSGIAQIAAQAGYNVIMMDLEEKFVSKALAGIDKFLAKSVEKGKITADAKDATMGRIKGTTKMGDLKDVDYVVEAVFEDMELKKKVFKELDALRAERGYHSDEYLIAFHHRDCDCYGQTGEGGGNALL